MPLSAAASAPSVGTPTTAHQEPALLAAESSARSKEVLPLPVSRAPRAAACPTPGNVPRSDEDLPPPNEIPPVSEWS
jgi:hypothetical protein